MKKNGIVLLFFLVLAASTAVGAALKNATYWHIYNYGTIIFSVICGIILLNRK